jgi:hypothetical protein
MWGRSKDVDLVDTQELDRFFDRLDRVNMEQLMSMRAAWLSIERQVHEAAWANIREVSQRDDLAGEVDRVKKKAATWSQRGSDSVPYLMEVNSNWLAAKMDAQEAIVDAALAVALGNRLDEAARATLVAPWLRAIDADRGDAEGHR